jgi:hypothetical protein
LGHWVVTENSVFHLLCLFFAHVDWVNW